LIKAQFPQGSVTGASPADSLPAGPDPQHSVLVVDDEPVVRRFTTRVLTSEGYRVHEARDGVEARDFLHQSTATVHVVVSDIVMPRMNGVELLEVLSRSHPRLPVILMSGYGPADLAQRGIPAPCAVLAKPFPPERLIAEVRRCIHEAGEYV
jgi:DNA-binding NtrC family response regulator